MKKRRASKKLDIGLRPLAKGAPNLATQKHEILKQEKQKTFLFSFETLDREHELFNLGQNDRNQPVCGEWFVSLLDCLKNASQMTFNQLCQSRHFDMHPINWNSTNARKPTHALSEQYDEWFQFRLSKSNGRIIGFTAGNVFYIHWLDPHHNLTNSEGYGKAQYYSKAFSEYELLQSQLDERLKEIKELSELLDKQTKP